MPTTIDEDTLKKIFNGSQPDHVTTQAKYWILQDGIKTAPTVYVPGENTIVIDGKPQVFKDGAFVYDLNGDIKALPGSIVDGGGITVDGGRVQPIKYEYDGINKSGNMATLSFKEGKVPGTGSLSLSMPRNEGPGFSIPWPAHTAEEIAKMAESEGAIVKVKDGSGETIEGFFAKGNGGAVPERLGPYERGTRFSDGDFVAISRRGNGPANLFTYRNYTPEQIAEQTRGGYAPYGNNINQLTTVDGAPLNTAEFPRLSFQDEPARVATESKGWFGKTTDAPATPPAGTPKVPDGTPPVVGPKLPTVKLDATPPAVEATSAVGKLARVLAPAALAITPVVEGISESYSDYQKDHSLVDAAGGAAVGAGKGVIDTYLPGARDGYSDVVGGGDKTALDRFLNAANDFTGTATAVGSTALVVESAGVISIPATIPTGIATFAAGVSNLGINAIKGALKVTGYAGKDQDGGYIYDGGKAAINGVEHLFGYDTPAPDTRASSLPAASGKRAEIDADNALKHSAAKANNTDVVDGKPKHAEPKKA